MTHPDISTENENAEDNLPPRRLSIKHHQKPTTQTQSPNDDKIITEIGKCIENLRTQKDILKAENAQLTLDIRKLNTLRLQQAALEAEIEQIIENIRKRHAQIEAPNRIVAKTAKSVRKMAARIEEDRWAELKMAEGVLEPFIEIDEEGKVMLKEEYEDDTQKETWFDEYNDARAAYRSLQAAVTRLRQSRMELLDLGDFVGKVEGIAIGDVGVPCDRLVSVTGTGMVLAQERDRERTPPARVRRSVQDRRNSLPLSTRDEDERRGGAKILSVISRIGRTHMALRSPLETPSKRTQSIQAPRRDITRSVSWER